MVVSIFAVKTSSRFDEGKYTKKSFKNLRYGPQKIVSKHLSKVKFFPRKCKEAR